MRTLLALVVLALTLPAFAQPDTPLPTPTAPAEPLLRTTSERFWTLSLRFRAEADEFADLAREQRGVGRAISYDSFDVERGVVIVPAIEGTSLHQPTGAPRAELRFDGDVVDEAPTLLPGYQNGERLARLDIPRYENADSFEAWVDLPMRSRSVAFDEERALRVDWPSGPWPAVCASALEAQLAIDPAEANLVEFVRGTVGAPPYDAPPALVAKQLAAAVINRFQPSGLGFEYGRSGGFGGIEFGPPEARDADPFGGLLIEREDRTARRFIGSPADMTALYCAALRAAGIPARPVIGYDLFSAPEGRDEARDFLPSHCGDVFQDGDSLRFPRLIYWAEFALYDEEANTLEWIPVDVFSQRRVSSRAHPVDQAWLFFGNNSCGEARLPISHHFFPPTTVVGMGAPLFWGWLATPEVPLLTQSLRVWAQGAAVTTSDDD